MLSTALRERDKAIQRAHDEELVKFKIALKKKNEENADLRQSLWNTRNRISKLMQDLGFIDLEEAQARIDGARTEDKTTKLAYRDCLELVWRLKDDLKDASMLNERWEAREKELLEEISAVRRENEEKSGFFHFHQIAQLTLLYSASKYRRLSAENKNLISRLEDAVESNDKAQQRRQKDYQKWNNFKRWILCTAEIAGFQQYDKQFGYSGRDKARELFKVVAKKKYKLQQLQNLDDSSLFELASSPPPLPKAAHTSPLGDSVKVNHQSTEANHTSSFSAGESPTKAADMALITPVDNTRIIDIPVSSLETKHGISEREDDALQFFAPQAKSGTFNAKSLTFVLPQVPSSPAKGNVSSSQTEDESQSLHWSQFPQAAFPTSTAPPPTNPTSAMATSSTINTSNLNCSLFPPPPSQAQRTHIPFLPSSSPPSQSQSPNAPRVLVVNSSPVKSTDGGDTSSTPNRATVVAPTYLSHHGPVNLAAPSDASSSRNPNTLSHAPQAPRPRLQSSDKDDNVRGDEYDEPPGSRKYLRSNEGRRVPSNWEREETRKKGKRYGRGRGRGANGRKNDDRESETQGRQKTDGSASILSEPAIGTTEMQDGDRWKSDGDRRKSEGGRASGSAHGVTSQSEKKKDKEREREENTPVGRDRAVKADGPAITTSKNKESKGGLDDYMPYKGRGRYGKQQEGDDRAADKTINELYQIDPFRNGGVDHEYNEVVRGNARRKLAVAEDCEECREYYRAVGPLPPRLQAPMWKSPTKGSSDNDTSPKRCNHKRNRASSSRKRGRHEGDETRPFDSFDSPTKPKCDRSPGQSRTATSTRASDRSAQAHKQAISRHRAAWGRATTPQNIGK
ncbi:hypothetical protein D9757_007405 [Collybiopsis confluens]|uniref:DNA endonuclease activator Ctp1 C-terminal domain-containing protein n=1 Tax=Collybiopsis confluens TaxID=2823264 RepID=A0A8H5HIM1_9AGAR|nr:hypothetical protein D9757_007405 [Collybiopsis confluens]